MWALASGSSLHKKGHGRREITIFGGTPFSLAALAADSVSGIRTSVSRLPWLTEYQKLSRAPPGFQCQTGTPEAPVS